MIPLIRIAIADDHPVIRRGIAAILNAMDGLTVSIESDDGNDLIRQIEKANELPDVCILDICMPNMDGFDTITILKNRWPNIGVLVLTVFDNELYFIRMIMSGASGYLLKSCSPDDIRDAVFSIHKNGIYYSDVAMRQFLHAIIKNEIKLPQLTATELILLKLSCTDLSYTEIADKMGTTSKSVEGYRENLFRKLNVKSRVTLAMLAVQFGFVQLNAVDPNGSKVFNIKA